MSASGKYMYVFVRTDISLNQQLVQAAHAACTAGEKLGGSESNLVLLGVSNENTLEKLSEEMSNEKISHVMFFEPDNNMGYSSLATKAAGIQDRVTIQKIIKNHECKIWNERID